LGIGVKSRRVQSELVEKKLRECRRCSLAHADDSDVRALDDAHGQAREAATQSQGREKSGAAGAQD
jgi:hypothetical protein